MNITILDDNVFESLETLSVTIYKTSINKVVLESNFTTVVIVDDGERER